MKRDFDSEFGEAGPNVIFPVKEVKDVVVKVGAEFFIR